MASITTPTDGGASPAAAPIPAGRLSVDSEVGVLRRVILHRPDLELKRLTPSNKDALLFDDVLWVKRARQEHDAFADALAERGVEVLHLQDLLAEVLALPQARREVLDGTLATVQLGRRLGGALRDWLAELPGTELARRLIGGIAAHELPFRSSALAALVPPLNGFVLAPLPNHVFTRGTRVRGTGGRAQPKGVGRVSAAAQRPQRVEDHRHVDPLLQQRAGDRRQQPGSGEAHRDDAQPHPSEHALTGDLERTAADPDRVGDALDAVDDDHHVGGLR